MSCRWLLLVRGGEVVRAESGYSYEASDMPAAQSNSFRDEHPPPALTRFRGRNRMLLATVECACIAILVS